MQVAALVRVGAAHEVAGMKTSTENSPHRPLAGRAGRRAGGVFSLHPCDQGKDALDRVARSGDSTRVWSVCPGSAAWEDPQKRVGA